MKMRHSIIRPALLGLTTLALLNTGAEARRLKVLFLGHKPGMHQGHNTQERYMDLLAGLAPRGVDMDFTVDPAHALNSKTLGLYDALAIYANWEKITPDQETALLSYVNGGGGFVPIHSASYCFLNSMQYANLVGARFKSHVTGEFDISTTPEGQQHALLKGYKPFRTWDETYVHTLHTTDRTILQRRVDPSRGEDEPWTWTRNQGKGRVFYTAYGHDQRTWTQSGFHDLIYRGLNWAVGEDAAEEHQSLELAPLPYATDGEDAGYEVPNYEKRSPAPRLQKPLSPEESQKRITVPAGMELSLFASEKDGLWNVISFRFDEMGRMWTCESLDYPNERKPQGQGSDRIRILEDTNGDGQADKFTVFAEKLSIPTSLVFANGGVIVHNLPDTTFLKDTNADGKADEQKVLFTGWGVFDTHACASNLAYGFDGWIYGCVGYSGFDGTVGGKHHKFGQGIYRFKQDGSELEFLGKTSNNTWGFGLNENGDLFGSTANGQSSFYCAIPKRYFDSVPGLKQSTLPGIDANKRAPIAREYIRQVDWFGGFTSAACHNFYTARSFPEAYWNTVAFVAEPTCHILYQAMGSQKGTNFEMQAGMNLLASDDEWFAPVHADVGPDGSVYVSDFYSFLIQHNPTPSVERGGFAAKNGGGNAFISSLRDTERCRLWKVTNKQGAASKTFKLSTEAPAVLLEALASDNLLWRSHAQRLLIERGKADDVAKELKALVASPQVDEVGVDGGAFGALWVLDGLKALDEATLQLALAHPAQGVKRAALQLLPRTDAGRDSLMKSGLHAAGEPLVRLTALLALSEMPSSGQVGNDLYKLAQQDEAVAADTNLNTALTIASAKHALGYLGASLANARASAGGNTPATPAAEAKNLFPNPSFEDARDGRPAKWSVRNYNGQAQHSQDTTVARTGKASALMVSESGSDTSFHTDLELNPGTDYVFSGWIKTEKLSRRGSGKGAMLELHSLNGDQPHTDPITGTNDWKEVSLRFNTGKQTQVSFNLLFGGWGQATGKMWVDDVKLVAVGDTGGDERLGSIAASFVSSSSAEAKSALAKVAAAKAGSPEATLITKLLGPAGAEAPKEETMADLAKTHQVVEIKAVPNSMKYDVATLNAKAGQPILIKFSNPDALQHNLIIGKPGTHEKLNAGSMKMMSAPDGQAKGWVPDSPDVLGKTKMLDPNQSDYIKLPALQPGEYPLLCTFPAHGNIMKATLIVK